MSRYFDKEIEKWVFECDDCGDKFYFDSEEELEDNIGWGDIENIYYNFSLIDVCQGCYEEYEYCEHCGNYYRNDDTDFYQVGYSYYCKECAIDSGEYIVWENCGDIVDRDEAYYSESRDEWYCKDCAPNEIISEWHDHKGAFLTFNSLSSEEPNRYYGLELEVDRYNYICNDDVAQYIRDNIFNENEMYFENDGSLWYGFELITQPMTFNYIKSCEEQFKQLMSNLQYHEYTGENNNCAGLHIHVSNNDINTIMEEKIAYFLENNIEDTLILSRRGDNFGSYCKPILSNCRGKLAIEKVLAYKDEITNMIDIDEFLNQYLYEKDDRYHLLNVTNDDTIEFRFFKSTLNHNHLIACVELVNAIVDMVVNDELDYTSTWSDVIRYANSDNVDEYVDYCYNQYEVDTISE